MAYVPASKLIDINALEEFRKKSQWRLSRDSDSVVLTGPKGETTSVDVGAINADKINSNTEKINSLQSDTVTIKNTLTAHGARITTLETDSLEVKNKITADEADIADLKTNTLTVDSADARYAAIDDLDAINASIESLETTKLSADDADIKYATIQNLSAATGRIDTLESTALTTDTADIRYASITNLNAATARISDLETTALTTDTADIRYATIANLNTEKARIDTLETDALTADTADLRYAAIGDLNAATARIGTLESDMITADQADLKYATIQNLDAANANIQSLQTDKLDATDLTAYQATVTDLLANKADIDLANIGTGVIKTAMIENGAITTALIGTGAVETAQIADGSITDGKIVSLSATKISAGTLDAAKIDVVHLNAASITVGQINGTQIANGAIDLDQLSSGVANTISSNTANVAQALNDIGVLQDDVGTATADAQSAKATANSALAKINEAIQEVDVEYAVGDSSSTAPDTGWSTDSPQWQAGKYIWQRTKVVDGDDNISYSEPTCIQGAKGQDGQNGQNGQDGKDGKDGVSPTITTSKTGTVTTLTITDSTGTSTATINDGAAGSRGTSWYAGTAITGTSTTAAVFSGSGVATAIVGDHYLNTSTQNVYICKKAGNASTATWAYEMNIKGADGTPGTNGTNGIDGKTAYLHVKYSNDGGQTFTGNSGEDAGTYIGTYSDNTQADSTSVSKYTWIKIEGEDGEDGISPTVVASKSGTVTTITITDVNGTRTATVNDGTNGSRGATWYAGTAITGTSTSATIFSGSGISSAIVGDHYLNTSTQNVYVCAKAGNASTATWKYEQNIKGASGTPGTNGANGTDGKSAYLHVKYSNDGGTTFTSNSGEDTGSWIGTYTDDQEADSTSVSAYKWVKIEGTDGKDGKDGSRGATWYAGTAITGTSTTATKFTGSGITSAITGDHYLNTSTQNVYVCVTGGNASTATWKYEQNIKGATGTPGAKGDPGTNGTNGTDGKTAYMHVKYSNDGGATFTSNSGEDPGSYIGTYSDNTAADSTSVSKYTWVRIEGLDGEDGVSPIITSSKSGTVTTITITDASGTKTATLNDGAAGARGATWYAGTKITGTSTTAAVFSGSGISSAIVGDHYLNTSTQNVYVCKKAGNASTATWAYEENIKGETGQAGTNGTNGKTAYFHVKYSNDGGATFTGNSGEDTGTYIGTYSDNNATDSTSVSAYKWVKIEGIDGEDGVSPTITTSKTGSVSTITIVDALGTKRVNVNDGVVGARGATWYAGDKITGTSTTATVFSGSGISNAIVGDHYLNTATQNVYVCAKAGAASTATWKYEQNIKGATGATGPTGPDGKTAYFHVKYSNDGGQTFTANSGETAGTYIGTYTDNTAADSTSVSKYTWIKIEGIDGEDGISITKVEEQYYLSTSDTTQTGGSWSTTQPAWSSGKYIWTRSHITFSNNTTSDTTPVLAKAINSANTTANSANTTAQSANTTANSAKTAADNAVLVATTAQTSADKALSSTEIIIGTQTASTGAWTGNASFATLEDGQSIIYWLPFAGSGNATLNLTLSTGLTTGAKNCYYSGTTRLSTHYAAGNAIRLTYMKAANVNGTSYEGWWADANQNTDTYDRVRYNWSITAASAITAGQLLVADSDGKYKPLTTASFDVSKPILCAGSAIAASKTGTNNYIAYPNVNVTVTKSGFTGTNLATLYLYGTLSGSTFTPNSNLFTTTVPTSMTTDTYIAVGQMRSTTACYLYPEHPMYRYYNGKFQSITQLAYEAFISADTAQDKADAAQQTADSASGTANTALQTANGKNKVFHQTSAPATGMQTNDTWFDTDDGYKMYRYNGSSWVAEQFNSNAIADAAITNAKIKDATIQSAKIATLDAGKITTGTLAADRIGANSITAAKIATGTITSTQIASGTIKASNIATGSITADLIGAGVISADHLASKSITSDKIVSGAVTADKIAASTITANEIASGTITAGLIASNAVTAAKIAAGAVTAAKIGAGAVTADKIEAGAVTADKIDVSDLYALGATIGGFVINKTSIASKDKSTNGGIQLNKDGSVDIGDSNSYIRYADGNLDMRVTSLTIGGSGVATAAQLTNMSDTVNSIATAANTTANSALVRADDAAKTATNFLHYDSVYGLVVTQSPVASASAVANITDSNLRITSDSVDVFKGQKRLARYGANVILGDEDASNVLIDPSSGLQVRSGADVLGSFSTSGVGLGVSRDNKPYMNINPEAFSIKQIIQVTDDSGSYPQVLDDDIFSISFNSDVTYGELGTESGDVLTMETGEALGYTEGEAIAQLQFGVENDSRGVGTAVFGEGLEAISRYSFAVGRYNKATGTDLFVVGNGNGDSTRSNALTIDKSGLVTIPGRIVNTATPTGNTDLVNKAYVDNAIKALYKLITGNNYPS